MNIVFETLANAAATPGGAASRATQARSLFLWHLILGAPDIELGQTFPDAAPAMRQLASPLVMLPAGCEVTPLVQPIGVQPQGFDIQPDMLPGADGVFAFVATEGLRLVASMQTDATGRTVRRLQVLNASGAVHRRTGTERFMLRYRLNRAVLQAMDVAFLSIIQTDPSEPGAGSGLHVWIEIDRDFERHFVVTEETRTAKMPPGDTATLAAFAYGSIPSTATGGEVQDVFLFVELTGDIIDVRMAGEQLLF